MSLLRFLYSRLIVSLLIKKTVFTREHAVLLVLKDPSRQVLVSLIRILC